MPTNDEPPEVSPEEKARLFAAAVGRRLVCESPPCSMVVLIAPATCNLAFKTGRHNSEMGRQTGSTELSPY